MLGNNGFLIPSLIYIYIGASAAKIITIFTDKDSILHQYDTYFIAIGSVLIVVVIVTIVFAARREL